MTNYTVLLTVLRTINTKNIKYAIDFEIFRWFSLLYLSFYPLLYAISALTAMLSKTLAEV